MASNAVDDAFRARIAATMAASPSSFSGLVLRPLNGRQEADASSADLDEPIAAPAFLELQFPTGDARQIGLAPVGARDFREEGTARLVLEVPGGRDLGAARTMIETLGRALGSTQFAGVTTWEASPPITDDQTLDGAWWALAIVVPYFFDYRA